MRIPSGVTDQFVYFVAVDDTDFVSRETGLSSFTVYRSRNGAAASVMTTPTINETDVTNMPGVYELLLDEDMTIGSGNDSEEMAFHITHAGMAPVTRTIELYRPKITAGNTLGVAATGDISGNIDGNVDGSVASVTAAVSVTGTPDVNVAQISGDATAADNLEAMFDGTGYSDASAPSTQSQVDGIGAASGGSLNFAAEEDNTGGAIIDAVTFVGSQTNTFAATESEDGTNHVIDDATNAFDIVYGFDIGGGRTGVEVTFKGYLNGGNDECNLQVYDHVGADWETLQVVSGQAGSTNVTLSVALLSKHTGTSGELGKVYVRFVTSGQSNPQLNIDQLLVAGVNIGQSVGYALGAIWLDTNNGVSGVETFVNGVADNPCATWANVLSLSSSLGIKRVVIAAGSSITFTGATTDWEIMGESYDVAFGGQSLNGSHITGATVSGTFTGTTCILERCIINAITGPGMTMRNCFFNEVTITSDGAGDWFLNDCRSRVAGSGSPNFDFGAAVANTNVSLRSYSGGIELENMGGAGTDRCSIEGDGNVTLNANCSGGTLVVRGNFNFTDNASGAVNVVLTTPSLDVVNQGTAQAGTVNTITLAATASSTDGQYDPGEIIIVAGAGAGQSRNILDYDGTTKVAVVGKDWRTNPDSTSSYVVRSLPSDAHVNEGQAQGGASATITLNSAASSTDDIYIGQTVFLVGGTGQDQSRIVTDYNGTTKVATVHKAWDVNPDSTTSYIMLPLPSVGDTIVNTAANIGTPTDTDIATDIQNLVDQIFSDSNAEPTGVPAATAALATKVATLYMMARNQVTVTGTQKTFYDDSGAAEFTKGLTDDGSTYTETEVGSP